MCALNDSVHLNRGSVKNDKAVIKVCNFSLGSCKQWLALMSLYTEHDSQCFYASYHGNTSEILQSLLSPKEPELLGLYPWA